MRDPGDESDVPEWAEGMGIVPNAPTKGSIRDLINGCPRCGRVVVRRRRDGAKHCRKCDRTFYSTHGEERARVLPDFLDPDWNADDGG